MSHLSDDEDMTSSTPSTPSTPVHNPTTSTSQHSSSTVPPHLDLKTPPQSQDNTPYHPNRVLRETAGFVPGASTTSASGTAVTTGGGLPISGDPLNTDSYIGPDDDDIDSPGAEGGDGSGGTRELLSHLRALRRGSSLGGAIGSGNGNGNGNGTGNGGVHSGVSDVSILHSTEKGVVPWQTKRALEEISAIEEKLIDKGFNTQQYADIFNEKDMILQKTT